MGGGCNAFGRVTGTLRDGFFCICAFAYTVLGPCGALLAPVLAIEEATISAADGRAAA